MERNRKLKISRKIYIVIVEYFSTEKREVSIDFELFSLNFVELLRDEYKWKQIERTFSRFRATAPLPIRTVMRRNSSFHPPFSFLSSPRVHRSALPFSISCKRSRDLSYFLTPGGLDLGLLPRGSINQWEEDWRRLTSTNCVNGPDSNGLVSPRRAESNSLPWKFSFSLSSLPLSFSFSASIDSRSRPRGRIGSIFATTTDRLWIVVESR